MIPADGCGSRRSWTRTCSRNSSRRRRVTGRCPPCWTCQYTVCQGGKSTGSCRHEQPLRTTYKMASTTVRRGCFGIRPGDLISGSIGSTISHCASVRSDGYRRCRSMPRSPRQPPLRRRHAVRHHCQTPTELLHYITKHINFRESVELAEYLDNDLQTDMQEGNLVLLFDSFDEIPSIVGSASIDRAVRPYVEVITNLMGGGRSKCIVASREYRGPRVPG